jgi:hypothetical protein
MRDFWRAVTIFASQQRNLKAQILEAQPLQAKTVNATKTLSCVLPVIMAKSRSKFKP